MFSYFTTLCDKEPIAHFILQLKCHAHLARHCIPHGHIDTESTSPFSVSFAKRLSNSKEQQATFLGRWYDPSRDRTQISDLLRIDRLTKWHVLYLNAVCVYVCMCVCVFHV